MTPSTLPTVGAAIHLRDLPQYAAWLAADARDLEIQDPGDPNYLDSDWQREAEHGRALLDAAGYTGRLGIHAAYEGMELFVRDRMLQEVIRTRLLQSLAFGQVLGATHMVIHSPFVSFGHALVNYAPAPYRAPIIANVHALLEPVLRQAEAQGCTLVIENILDKNPQPLLDLVRSFASPFVRLSIDTGHAYVFHREGGAPPHQWVLEAGELLGHVHLQDVDGLADRHWALGDGDINWRAFFGALAMLPHQPRLVLEVAEVMRSFAWLTANGLAR